MGIIVDLIIVIAILLSAFLGYKKGLVDLAIKICAFAISLVIAFVLYFFSPMQVGLSFLLPFS